MPERAALDRLLAAGLVHVDVANGVLGPAASRGGITASGYSRNLGMQTDLIAGDHTLAGRLDTTWIDHVGRSAEQPSDHAAIMADFRQSSPILRHDDPASGPQSIQRMYGRARCRQRHRHLALAEACDSHRTTAPNDRRTSDNGRPERHVRAPVGRCVIARTAAGRTTALFVGGAVGADVQGTLTQTVVRGIAVPRDISDTNLERGDPHGSVEGWAMEG